MTGEKIVISGRPDGAKGARRKQQKNAAYKITERHSLLYPTTTGATKSAPFKIYGANLFREAHNAKPERDLFAPVYCFIDTACIQMRQFILYSNNIMLIICIASS